jgi:hypothetical protein
MIATAHLARLEVPKVWMIPATALAPRVACARAEMTAMESVLLVDWIDACANSS